MMSTTTATAGPKRRHGNRAQFRYPTCYGPLVTLLLLSFIAALLYYPLLQWGRRIRRKYCLTDDCRAMARELKRSMAKNIRPCRDFYAYVCGRWEEANPTYRDQHHRSHEELLKDIRRLLQNWNYSTHHHGIIERAAKTFTLCSERAYEGHPQVTSIMEIFKIAGPFIDIFSQTPNDIDVADVILAYQMDYGIDILFDIGVKYLSDDAPDAPNARRWTIALNHPILPSKAIMAGNRIQFSETIKKAIKMVSDEPAEQFEKNAFKAEKKLADMLLAAGASQKTLIVQADDLVIRHPKLGNDFINKINRHLQQMSRIRGTDYIYVNNRTAVIAGEFIQYLQSNMPEAHAFIGWRLLTQLGLFGTQIMGPLNNLTIDELVQETGKTVLQNLIRYLSMALIGPYVINKNMHEAKMDFREMLFDIQMHTKTFFSTRKWMDQSSFSKFVGLLDTIEYRLIYPELDHYEAEVEHYYRYMPTPKYFDCFRLYAYMISRGRQAELLLVNQMGHYYGDPWFLHSFGIRFLSTHSKHIAPNPMVRVFPLEYATRPFYLPTLTKVWNYGGAGRAMVSEVLGPLVLNDSDITSKWSSDAQAKFKERAKCLIEQYYKVGFDQPKILTTFQKAQYITDNYALRIAMLSYLSSHQDQGTMQLINVRHLDKFHPLQLFYISSCLQFCSDTESESYARMRCNGPLMNDQIFHDAFKCAPGTFLNPNDKCTL